MASSTKIGVARAPVRVPFRRNNDGDSDQEQEDQKPVVTSKAKTSTAQKAPLDSGKKVESKKVTSSGNDEVKKTTAGKTVRKPVKKVEEEEDGEEEDTDKTSDRAERTDKKKAKKQEDPAELRRKFMNTFPEIHANARAKFVFVVAGRPKSFLQIGGMRAQFGKNKKIAYSLQLNTAGTIDDIDEMLANPVIHEYLVKEGIIGEDGDEDEIRSTLITAENFETRKEDKDFKAFNDSKNNTRDALDNFLDSLLKTEQPNAKKETAQEKIKGSFAAYRAGGKVYDVTNWDSERHVGYKTVTRPNTRSQKHLATTLPIIANDPQKISAFVVWLGFDTETARREAALDGKVKHAKNDA